MLPKEMLSSIPTKRILTEDEWRNAGVQQSRGWEHYAIFNPEPHVLLFKRPHGTDPMTGKVDPVLAKEQIERYHKGLLE